ncbi:17618_t:CDS:2, partial [Acaulospora morrowiae]
MPPLPTNVPSVFINAVIENDRGDGELSDLVKNQRNTLLASSLAEKEVVFASVQRIDDKIRNVKAEVLQLIHDRQDEFITLYN